MENFTLPVGVIIVNYKTPQKTEECVKSLLKSNYDNFLVYVVDNGSGDESTDYFRKVFKDEKKVKLIFLNENFGYGGAVNRVFEETKKKHNFFLISNSDIFYDKNALFQLVSVAYKLRKENVYYPVTMFPNSQNRILSAGLNSFIPSPFQLKHFGKISKSAEFIEAPHLSGSCFLIERSLFEKAKGFDENYFLYCEDIDLGMKLKKIGVHFFAVPNSKIWHMFHGSSSRFSPLSRYYLARNVPVIIKKYFDKKLSYFFIFYLWGILSLLMLVFTLKWKSVLYYCLGTIDFFKGKTGRLSFNKFPLDSHRSID